MSAGTTRPCPFCGEDARAGAPACVRCGVALSVAPPRVVGETARPASRLLGALVDMVMSYVIAGAIWLASPASDRASVWLAWIAIAGYEIVGTALWGRTIGKLVARTRVVRTEGGAVPGFSVAVTRWFVVSIPLVLSIAWMPAEALALPWAMVVYAPILASAHRGLHDRVAHTLVVNA